MNIFLDLKSSKLFLLLAILVPTAVFGDFVPAHGQVAATDAPTEPRPPVDPIPNPEPRPPIGVDPENQVDNWPVVIEENGDNVIKMEKANAGYKAVNLVFQGMGGDASQSFAYDNVPAGAYPVINVKINSIRTSEGGVIDIEGLGGNPADPSKGESIFNVNIVNDITSKNDTALRFIDGFQSGDGGRANIRVWKGVKIIGSPFNNNGALQLKSKRGVSNQADLLLEKGSIVESTKGPALKLSNTDNLSAVDLYLVLDPKSKLIGEGENAIEMTNGIKHQLSVRLNGNAEIQGDIQYGYLSNPEEGEIVLANEGEFNSSIKGRSITGKLADANVRLVKKGSGLWRLNKPNYYSGNTVINEGNLKLGHVDAIPAASKTIVKEGGTLTLSYRSPKIDDITLDSGNLSGAPADIFKQSARIRHGALTGTITSKGGVLENIYGDEATLKVVSGRTLIQGMEGYGSDTDVSLGTVIVEGGQLWAQDEENPKAATRISNLTLSSPTNKKPVKPVIGNLASATQDGLVLDLRPNKRPAITVTEKFQYDSGNIYLYAPNSIDPEKFAGGNWKPLDFKTGDLSEKKYSEMFSNTYLMVQDKVGNIGYYKFNGDGSINPLNDKSQLLRPVKLKKGSMVLEVGEVDLSSNQPGGGGNDNSGANTDSEGSNDSVGTADSGENDNSSPNSESNGSEDSGANSDSPGTTDTAGNSDSGGGNSGGSSNSSEETIEEEIEDEIIDEIVGGEDFEHDSNQDGDSTGEGGGSLDFEEGALEDVVVEKGLWTKKDLIEVVKRGLLPRNVDGAGQTLATYNNLLADAIFERTPMRQFTEVGPEVAVEPTPDPEVVPAPEPVQGLWSKSGEMNEAEANAYLDEATAPPQPLVVADAHTAAEHQGEHLIEINGKIYADNVSLTAEYAGRDGVRGWFRGFGGSSADSNGESGTIFNPYTISAIGGVVGVDVSLSESFQLGAYANYGDISLSQRNGVEDLGGGWNADGWGGGVTADYWTQNFYIQGLLGVTGFSGEQRRHIAGYGSLFDNQTAKGDKHATSMVGALRLGAPFQSGSTYIEPQLTATWSGNSEHRFSESADNERLGLTYKSRKTNYLQTALGVKFAWPMKTGNTGLFTPSLKLAWLADWDKGNDGQTIGFNFSDKTYKVGSNQDDVNGALIEAGLDYSLLKLEGTTVKGYLRGGAEVWGGNRGTNWRASGGLTFQF